MRFRRSRRYYFKRFSGVGFGRNFESFVDLLFNKSTKFLERGFIEYLFVVMVLMGKKELEERYAFRRANVVFDENGKLDMGAIG